MDNTVKRSSTFSEEDDIAEVIKEYSDNDPAMVDYLRREDIVGVLYRELVAEEIEKARIEVKVKKATEQITQQVTQQAVKDNYNTLIKAGVSHDKAIELIANEKGISAEEVQSYLH